MAAFSASSVQPYISRQQTEDRGSVLKVCHEKTALSGLGYILHNVSVLLALHCVQSAYAFLSWNGRDFLIACQEGKKQGSGCSPALVAVYCELDHVSRL